MQARRHDLNISSGTKEANAAAGFSSLASAKNQGSLQKKLQPSSKPLSGTRLSKSSKKQKYSHRGPPPPDQIKNRDFALQNQANLQQMIMQQPDQQKIYAS